LAAKASVRTFCNLKVKAVWSFWSKPEQHRLVWPSQRHHLMAWVLSLQTVRQHYRTTMLCTDTAGAKLLVDSIGLEFENVSTALDALEQCDPGWWVLGKLYAYRAQTDPFIHFDNDVFLWKRFPAALESAQVLAQNPEDFLLGTSYYAPETFDNLLRECGGWLPEEWKWYAFISPRRRATCCGFLGANNVDFIRYYAETAISLIEHSCNQLGWARLINKTGHNHLVEQYLLSACINYHHNKIDSPFHKIDIRYLFAGLDEAFCSQAAKELGYTHLLGSSKRNAQTSARLERRIQQDYPEYYERIIKKAA
jgi:hypothetical protein